MKNLLPDNLIGPEEEVIERIPWLREKVHEECASKSPAEILAELVLWRLREFRGNVMYMALVGLLDEAARATGILPQPDGNGCASLQYIVAELKKRADETNALRAELEQTRRELEKTKARLETYWKKGDEDFATLVALRQALTAAEQRAEGLSALNQAHAEHLAAARADFDRVADERDTALQRAEGAVRHDEQMNVALGKLAPKGTWLCEVLENIWRAPSQAEAVKIAEAAAPEVKAGGLWSGPRVRENLEEAERQRDTAIRERDEAAKDTARLDWLEKCNVGLFVTHYNQSGNVRTAIDAALAAKTTEGGVRP